VLFRSPNATAGATSGAPTATTPSAIQTAPLASPTSAVVPTTATKSTTPAKLATGAFQVTQKSAYSCTAQAPADWTMSSRKEADSADLYSADKSMYAGYGIQAVNENLAPYAGVYQAPLNNPDLYSSDPATYVKAMLGIVVQSLGESGSVSYTDETNQTIGNYTLRSFSAGGYKGLVLYYTDGIPGDGVNYSYIEPFYVSAVPISASSDETLLVFRVAASINCTTQLVQHEGPLVKAQTSGSSSGSSSSNSESGYNVQLGTEYVHDPETGTNYLVSNADNWSDTGPDGPGYYVITGGGNSYQKLAPGIQ
jgi:hypothetical protein